MKIAYLMHYMGKNYEEVTENIDQLLDGGDDVYFMINDEDLRDEVFTAYADEPRARLSITQPAALPADLSMPRGMLLQIKQALEVEEEIGEEYDWFINLTDGMIPIANRNKITDFLDSLHGQDCYHVVSRSSEDPEAAKRMNDYAFFTNSLDFQKSHMIQGMNKLTQKTVGLFKKREMDDEVVVTLPWFILSHDSAEVLEENFPYCSNTFKMCMYPEELCVGTMLAKFSDAKHVDKNVWAIGKNGYELMKPIKPADRETIRSMPEALFAAKINADNIDLYQDTFDLYTQKD